MKAIIQKRYGDEQTLERAERKEPVIVKDDEFLVRVMVGNVSAGDCKVNTLDVPFPVGLIMRLVFGLRRPRHDIRGISGSGQVIRVGSAVKAVKTGDHVNFINSIGASVLADVLKLNGKSIYAKVDETVSYADSAPVAFGAMTAFHFINDTTVKEGSKVLVYGASGSVGSYAAGLAHALGANVTATASRKHHPFLQGLGIDRLIDYRNEDPFTGDERYDLIFDAVGKITGKQVRHVLADKGVYRSVRSVTKEDRHRLERLNTMLASGKIKTVIDRIYPFEAFREAHRHVYDGHKTGNVLIEVNTP
jgi:NADPH:quinone reductase-like Zn-dependent oxidoreductase